MITCQSCEMLIIDINKMYEDDTIDECCLCKDFLKDQTHSEPFYDSWEF